MHIAAPISVWWLRAFFVLYAGHQNREAGQTHPREHIDHLHHTNMIKKKKCVCLWLCYLIGVIQAEYYLNSEANPHVSD